MKLFVLILLFTLLESSNSWLWGETTSSPSRGSSGDRRCTNKRGQCQENDLHCSGRYVSGLCAGHASRKCCLPRSSSSSSSSSSGISQQCLNCICKHESGCQPLKCKWDVNSNSCGYFQIKHDYWVDCGRPGSSWESCAMDKSCSERCVRKYMKRYGKHCTRGHTPTCKDYARIHNGGPHGCRNRNTVSYWPLVAAKGCSVHS